MAVDPSVRRLARVLNLPSLNGRTFDIISFVGRFAARLIGRELAMEKRNPFRFEKD